MLTEEEVKYAFIAMDEYKRQRALEAIFIKGNFTYELSCFNWFVRTFCLLKTWICLKLNRTKGSYMDENKFCISTFDEQNCGEYMCWESCWVSPSLFKDWNVCLTSDSN